MSVPAITSHLKHYPTITDPSQAAKAQILLFVKSSLQEILDSSNLRDFYDGLKDSKTSAGVLEALIHNAVEKELLDKSVEETFLELGNRKAEFVNETAKEIITFLNSKQRRGSTKSSFYFVLNEDSN